MSRETETQSVTTSSTIRPNSGPTGLSQEYSINLAPISHKQTDNLKELFKRFKFNDNDLYKYRLRAVIKHMGSHTQGHYECYKHKPLYVKDKNGNIFKLSPEIKDELTGEIHCEATPVELNPAQSNANNGSATMRSSSSGSSENDEGFRHKFSTMMGRRPSVFKLIRLAWKKSYCLVYKLQLKFWWMILIKTISRMLLLIIILEMHLTAIKILPQ